MGKKSPGQKIDPKLNGFKSVHGAISSPRIGWSLSTNHSWTQSHDARGT